MRPDTQFDGVLIFIEKMQVGDPAFRGDLRNIHALLNDVGFGQVGSQLFQFLDSRQVTVA